MDSCEEGVVEIELCDVLDNDCDGIIDEENVCFQEPELEETDLTIGIECTPELMLSGQNVSCIVVYKNIGDVDAEDVNIVIGYQDGISLDELPSIPGVTCTEGSILCGGLGYTLLAGETVSFGFTGVVTGNASDVYDINASIGTNTPETNEDNNTDFDQVGLEAVVIQTSTRGGGDNYCGDGVVFSTEQCDDGNNLDGDGCTSNCFLEKKLITTQDVGEMMKKNQIIETKDNISTFLEGSDTEIQMILEKKKELVEHKAAENNNQLKFSNKLSLPLLLPETGSDI